MIIGEFYSNEQEQVDYKSVSKDIGQLLIVSILYSSFTESELVIYYFKNIDMKTKNNSGNNILIKIKNYELVQLEYFIKPNE